MVIKHVSHRQPTSLSEEEKLLCDRSIIIRPKILLWWDSAERHSRHNSKAGQAIRNFALSDWLVLSVVKLLLQRDHTRKVARNMWALTFKLNLQTFGVFDLRRNSLFQVISLLSCSFGPVENVSSLVDIKLLKVFRVVKLLNLRKSDLFVVHYFPPFFRIFWRQRLIVYLVKTNLLS